MNDQKTLPANIKVLMYHRVLKKEPIKESRWHYVTVSVFKKQLAMIERFGYTPITFYDYQLYLEDKLTLPAKPIIITFDDGYVDTYKNALPILKEMDMKAVIFVMGNRELKRARWDEVCKEDECPLMSDDQVRSAHAMGIEIGSHSLNHEKLSTLKLHEAEQSIRDSKAILESILEQPVYTFSYPYGDKNRTIEKLVEKAGYKFACGVYTGSPKFGETTYDFRRLAINQHSHRLNFLLKIIAPYEYLESYYHQFKNGIQPAESPSQFIERDVVLDRSKDRAPSKKSENHHTSSTIL